MPAAMKFFQWTVGSLATGPSTMGMLGGAAAAGVHAASSVRGIGGYRTGDPATYMDDPGPGSTFNFPVCPITDLSVVQQLLGLRSQFAGATRQEPVDFIRPVNISVH